MEHKLESKSHSNQAGIQLLSIPEEVFYRSIFPHLQYTDLLRLRKVCKAIKLFSSGFIRNKYKSHVREINEKNYTFQHFLQADLPTASIYLNNSSSSFFEHPDIPTFLNLHGDKIISLKVNHFATCISPPELHFFTSLPNLLHLDISFIDATKRKCMSNYKTINGLKVPRDKVPFPQQFKNLKTLKLNEIQGFGKTDRGYACEFIEFCENLEYIKHPLCIGMTRQVMDMNHRGPFSCVFEYIKKQHNKNPNSPNLKYYDLEHFGNDRCSYRVVPEIREFPDMVRLCYAHNIKLLNVYSEIFDIAQQFQRTPEVLTSPLVSLRDVHGYTFCFELPELEELVIQKTSHSSFANSWELWEADGDHDAERRHLPDFPPKWPKLRKLDMTINSKYMLEYWEPPNTATADSMELIDFLFKPENWKSRDELKDLAIRFGKHYPQNSRYCDGRIDHWPIPEVLHITQSCRFVKKLSLENWLGKNEEICMFWQGLHCLVEVELDECRELEDVAFVGNDWNDPVFLKLKKLRKLSLKGLDNMPKITDDAFKQVFSRLKIEQFCLTSKKPLKSITTAGIECLIAGDFNTSVEKFSFATWSLDGVSEEAFTHLKLKFRATDMI